MHPLLGGVKNLIFHDEITKVQEEVTRLINEGGVNKIVALGHAGYDFDKELAAAVEGVDIVVGGHTDTFLYTGKCTKMCQVLTNLRLLPSANVGSISRNSVRNRV